MMLPPPPLPPEPDVLRGRFCAGFEPVDAVPDFERAVAALAVALGAGASSSSSAFASAEPDADAAGPADDDDADADAVAIDADVDATGRCRFVAALASSPDENADAIAASEKRPTSAAPPMRACFRPKRDGDSDVVGVPFVVVAPTGVASAGGGAIVSAVALTGTASSEMRLFETGSRGEETGAPSSDASAARSSFAV